jgi:hypothetical protein
MDSPSRSRAVALAGVALLLAVAPGRAPGLTPEESTAVAVLTARFETVVFAAGPLVTGSPEPGSVLTALDAARVFASEGREILDAVRPGAGRSLAELSTSVLVGAKHFRAAAGPAAGLGGVRSTRCFVFTLRPRATYDAPSWLARTVRVAPARAVWAWTAPPRDGDARPVRWFAGLVGRSYFVLANDLDELRAAVGSLTLPGTAAPRDLLDAELLASQGAWAHRRYRFAEATDPAAAGLSNVSRTTTALVVVPDAASNTVRLRLHGDPGDGALARKLEAVFPDFERSAPGVWEAVILLGRSRTGDTKALLALSSLLGFAVSL